MSKKKKAQSHQKEEHHAQHKATHPKKVHHKAPEPEYDVWKVATFVLAALLVISIFTNGFQFNSSEPVAMKSTSSNSVQAKSAADSKADSKTTAKVASGDKARLEFYVMSQCPYGVQVEDAVIPVLAKLGDAVDFSVNYIATENGDGTFDSLHGPNEVQGNIVQLCAAEYNPDEYVSMIACMNKNSGAIPGNWESCASDNGLDVTSIKTCYEGQEGKDLLSKSIAASNAKNARGSPTMFLNGQPYNGGRDSLSFQRALCNVIGDNPECDNIPECGTDADCTADPNKIGKCTNPNEDNAKCEYVDPVKIEFIMINDKDCSTCDTSRIFQVSKQLFPGIHVTELDYSEQEAKDLLEELDLKILPAYIFDSNVVNAAKYGQVANALTKAGDYYYINPSAAGSTHDPTIPEIPKKLDLYVMSKCPYGSQAVQSMEEVLGLFGDQIDFNLNFIANDNGDGTFRSLHGQPEVDEDIRQVCVYDKFPEKAFEYVLCIAKDYTNAGTIWEGCADSVGIDTEVIKSCSESEEGKELLRENIKFGNELGIGSSPTFVINNKQRMGGAQPADTIKATVCTANPTLAGCDATLTQATATPTAAGAGCG